MDATYSSPVATDFRKRIAELQMPRYVLAGIIGLNPSGLAKVLNGRAPLTPELAEKLVRALRMNE